MENWESFYVAQAGASAALTGLVFVGVSNNMKDIVAAPALASRRAQAAPMPDSPPVMTASVTWDPA